jgi:hypothetical protein
MAQMPRLHIQSRDSTGKNNHPQTPKRIFFNLHYPTFSDAVCVQGTVCVAVLQIPGGVKAKKLARGSKPDLVLTVSGHRIDRDRPDAMEVRNDFFRLEESIFFSIVREDRLCCIHPEPARAILYE